MPFCFAGQTCGYIRQLDFVLWKAIQFDYTFATVQTVSVIKVQNRRQTLITPSILSAHLLQATPPFPS